MIIIITHYDYFLLWLLFLDQKEKQWVLDDECDVLRKFNPNFLVIIPFAPETPWMLTFSWENEQHVQSTAHDQKSTGKQFLLLW